MLEVPEEQGIEQSRALNSGLQLAKYWINLPPKKIIQNGSDDYGIIYFTCSNIGLTASARQWVGNYLVESIPYKQPNHLQIVIIFSH